MKYAIKIKNNHGQFLSRTNNSKDGLDFVERENKNFKHEVLLVKKKWEARVLCWLVNFYLKTAGSTERCIVVDCE